MAKQTKGSGGKKRPVGEGLGKIAEIFKAILDREEELLADLEGYSCNFCNSPAFTAPRYKHAKNCPIRMIRELFI